MKKDLNKFKRYKLTDIEKEEILLGTLIKRPIFANFEILNDFKPEYFYKHLHRKVFKAIMLGYSKYDFSITSIINRLEEYYKIENVQEIIANLCSKAVETISVEYEAEIMREKAIKRALISAGKKIISQKYNNITAQAAIEKAHKLIDKIARLNITDENEEFKDIIYETYEEISDKYENKNILMGYSTGFKDLDENLNGLRTSNLVVIGARPAMGKTSFALNLVLNFVKKTKLPVAYFSFEMNKKEVVKRMSCIEGKIDLQIIKNGNLYAKDWEKLAGALSQLLETNIFIDDTCDGTFTNLQAKCQQLKEKEKDLGLIVIDSLQCMDGLFENNRKQTYSCIISGLKTLAKKLNLVIIVLSSLPCTIEKRSNKRPMLSDIRKYCDNIDRCADVVMFLYREDYYNHKKSGNEKIAEIIVVKNKNGQTGTTELEFNTNTTKFKDADNNLNQKELIITLFDGKEL